MDLRADLHRALLRPLAHPAGRAMLRRPWVGRALARAVAVTIPTWYDPRYRLPLPAFEAQTGAELRRADFVAWFLRDRALVRRGELRAPQRIDYRDLSRVHTPELLDSLLDAATLARIFAVPASDVRVDELLGSLRLACGGTLAAAREALGRRGPTLNLLGGFHHAEPGRAGGFCAVNDVAVALATLRAEGFSGQAVVLDLDAHPPDGTARCLETDAASFIGSLSSSGHFGPLPRVDETVLPSGADDATYLEALDALLARMPRPDLAFVIAGGDVLAGDPLGGLGVTRAGVRERDRRVAGALEGRPSVWLPGGGYQLDAWRVLATTALVLKRVDALLGPDADPLAARFSFIASQLGAADLRGAEELGFDDIAADLRLGGRRRLLLDYYTAEGLELALSRYGVLDHLGRLGYACFRVQVEPGESGDRMRLFGRHADEEHLLIEATLERHTVAGHGVLYVHWLTLRDPRSRFEPRRPRLPGQDAPGLGLVREAAQLFVQVARRLGLDGVAFTPSWFHTAYAARKDARFVSPERQGRFEALIRDLADVPLLEATRAVTERRVKLDGQPYVWEADEMVAWLDPNRAPPDVKDIEATQRERDRCHFTLIPRPPSSGG